MGAKDADTSLTVTMILALKLMECGKTNVDYEIVWNEVHGRADYHGEMVELGTVDLCNLSIKAFLSRIAC